MGINSAKSWFAVDRSGKLVFFTDYINFKKGHSAVFFILYGNRIVLLLGRYYEDSIKYRPLSNHFFKRLWKILVFKVTINFMKNNARYHIERKIFLDHINTLYVK